MHSSDTLALQFKMTVWRVHTLEKAKVEADIADMARAWAEAKAREKAEIARLADEAREKTKFEARARNNENVINMTAVEASAKISFSADIQ